MPPVHEQDGPNRDTADNAEPYNTEALTYLDATFKEQVTAAVESCLDTQPADPVKYVAEQLLPSAGVTGNATSGATRAESDEGFVLNFEAGMHCTVKPVHRPPKMQAEPVAGLPIVRLSMPSTYEMESALGVLEETYVRSAHSTDASDSRAAPSQASIVVVVEPPPPPQEVVFLKGIPYTHTLAATLEYHHRRGTRTSHESNTGGSDEVTAPFSETALAKLKERLGDDDLVGFHEALTTVFTGGNTNISLAVIPAIQTSFLETFDAIDKGFYSLTHPDLAHVLDGGGRRTGGEGDAALMPWSQSSPPAVLFVSFDADRAPLTMARILASYMPYYETTQLRALAALRENSLEQVRKHNLDWCSQYWCEVHRRREAFDRSMAVAAGGGGGGGGARRIAGTAKKLTASTRPPSGTVAAATAAVAAGHPNDSAATPAASSVIHEQERQRAREARREEEDTAFLGVVRELESLAAARVQANFRAYRARKALRAMRGSTKHSPSIEDVARVAKVRFDVPYPTSLPPLLVLVAQRLGDVHGELFGNYGSTRLPEPHRRPVFIPHRIRSGSGKLDGHDEKNEEEQEVWRRRMVPVPPSRACERLPHFSPLRRLLEYHRLAGCDILHEALLAQKQLSGLNALQHRAYQQLKSVALDLLHIAHAELFHRGRLTLDNVRFSHFIRRQHAAVLAWFSQAHLVSKAALSTAPRYETDRGQRHPIAIADSRSLLHERMLTCGTGSIEAALLPLPSSHRTAPSQAAFVKIADNVYLTATALPIAAYEEVIREVAVGVQVSTTHTRQASGTTQADDNTTHSSITSRGPHDGSEGDSATESEVTLVNLCPHPIVYIAGSALVLAPVSPSQHLPGHPASNHVVIDNEEEERVVNSATLPSLFPRADAHGAEGDGVATGQRTRVDAATGGTHPDSPATPSRGRGYSHVVDGIDCRRRSQSGTRPSAGSAGGGGTSNTGAGAAAAHQSHGERANGQGHEDDDADSAAHQLRSCTDAVLSLSAMLVGGCLNAEEHALASVLRARLSNGEGVTLYEARGGSSTYRDTMLSAEVRATTVTLAQLIRGAGEATPPATEHEGSRNDDHTHSPRSPQPPARSRFSPVSISHSNNTSPLRRSDGDKGPNSAVKEEQPYAGFDSALSSIASAPPEQRTGAAQSEESTHAAEKAGEANPATRLGELVVPSAVAFASAFAGRGVGGGVRYIRAWVPHGLSGQAWLRRVDLFLEQMLPILKRAKRAQLQQHSRPVVGGPLLLAAQPGCADQTLFVAAAVLLSRAVDDAGKLRLVPAAAAASPTSPPTTAPADNEGMPVALPSYLDGFCSLLRSAFPKAGVDIDDCAAEVSRVLDSLDAQCSPSTTCFFTLSSILEDVEAAEREPVLSRCKAYILRAVQHTEHFCWLLVLQLFLSLPFSKPALDCGSDAPFTSFAAFATSISGATAWIDTIDPWADRPGCCPDATHVRYTNALRRWDSTDYICFAAI